MAVKPPIVRFKEQNPNRFQLRLLRGDGSAIVPSDSLSLKIELRTTETGPPLFVLPLALLGDPDDTLYTDLPKEVAAKLYNVNLQVDTDLLPVTRSGLCQIDMLPIGSLATLTDVVGMTTTLDETNTILTVVVDESISATLAAVMAEGAKNDTLQLKEEVEGLKIDVEGYKDEAEQSAQTATQQAGIAEGHAQDAEQAKNDLQNHFDSVQADINLKAGQVSADKTAIEGIQDDVNQKQSIASTAAQTATDQAAIATQKANDANASASTAQAAATASVAAFRGAWQPNTLYTEGNTVTNGGNTCRAKTTFTSGSSFNAANWDIVAQGGSAADGTIGEVKLDTALAAKVNGAYSYTDNAVAGVFDPQPITGYEVVGKGKLLLGSYLLQPVVAFDLTNTTWVSGASVVFSAKIKTKNANITGVSMRYFFNNNAPINNNAGTSQVGQGATTLTNGVLKLYSNTTIWNNSKSNYMHCYIDFVLPDSSVLGDVLIYDISLTVNGVSVPRVAGGMEIYNLGANDVITTNPTLTLPAATQAFATTKKTEAISSSNSYTDAKFTSAIAPTLIDGYQFSAKGNSVNPTLIQPIFAFDLTNITYTNGASFSFSCKIVSKSANITQINRIRGFFNAISSVSGAGGTSADIITPTVLGTNQTVVFSGTATYVGSKQNYYHAYIDLQLTDGTLLSDVLIYDPVFVIAGVTAPKIASAAIYQPNAGDSFTVVSSLPATVATPAYADTKAASALSQAQAYTDTQINTVKGATTVDGYRYVGVGNVTNPTLMQPILVFDTNGIDWVLGDTIAASLKLVSRSGNVTRINTIRVFINDVATLDNTTGASGNMGTNSASPVVGTALTYTASRSTTVKARYVHLYVDVLLTAPTASTTFDIYDATLTVKGISAPKVAGSSLYKLASATDSVTPFSYFDDQLAQVGFVVSKMQEAKTYADGIMSSKLKGKKWNALGDSITYGHGVGVNGTYRAVLESRWTMTARNYGISGTCLAGTSNSFGASMATRYVDMDNDADYITVFGMTNDWSAAIPIGSNSDSAVATLKGALNVLCQGLIEKYPTKKIGFITPLNHRTTNNSAGLSVLNYVDAMIEICALWSIPVLDLYRKGGVLPINVVQRGAVMYDSNSDGVGDDVQHPGLVGHAMLADRVEAFLLSL